jgi:putative membrane protein insertion efficiency factor
LHHHRLFDSELGSEQMRRRYVLRETSTPAAAGAEARGARSIGSWMLLLLVRMYIVFLSPFLGGACKFYPSCSNYAREAIERHGARRGALLALKRLLRCHPFTPGGIDFVPDELPDSSHTAHAHFAVSGQGKAR